MLEFCEFFEWKIKRTNNTDLFWQPPLLMFTKGANISGGHCIYLMYVYFTLQVTPLQINKCICYRKCSLFKLFLLNHNITCCSALWCGICKLLYFLFVHCTGHFLRIQLYTSYFLEAILFPLRLCTDCFFYFFKFHLFSICTLHTVLGLTCHSSQFQRNWNKILTSL